MSKILFDIVILTESRYINPSKKNWYNKQVLLEDKLLYTSLESLGLKVTRKDWTDKKFNFSSCKYAIFRTTWDYFDKINEFISWINETKQKLIFINSADTILWNLNKNYLDFLHKQNINIPKTIFLKKNDTRSLGELFTKTGWNNAVLKPAISGAAKNTFLISKNKYHKYNKAFNDLINKEEMLFQEFINDIEKSGEISLIMIGGNYTHSVRNIAKAGDFRVQDDHGGIVKKHIATNQEISFAKKCLEKVPFQITYARVDIMYDNNGKITLGELELIEPELWFRNNKSAADKLAYEIYSKIK